MTRRNPDMETHRVTKGALGLLVAVKKRAITDGDIQGLEDLARVQRELDAHIEVER